MLKLCDTAESCMTGVSTSILMHKSSENRVNCLCSWVSVIV